MRLFSYGTLCLAEVMEKVAGRRFRSDDAVLPGYRSFLIRGHVYPGMIHTGESFTPGKLYYDIDDRALARIDAFEGDYYRRETVMPVLEDGTAVEAYAYILVDSLHYLLGDKPWSEEEFRRKHLRRYLGRQV